MISIDLYRKMFLVRCAEAAIKKYYHEDDMRTPMHMSEGSEAVIAGVCACLNDEDQVFGSYRSHALYLCKTEETDQFFAEMYGKYTGGGKGKGGSMHLSCPSKGHMLSSAIVGTSIPVAVGCAYANKFKQNNRIAVTFFGDGATEEGCFWESLNMACLYNLPIVFVCEDNDFAVHTRVKNRHGHNGILNVVSQFNCNTYQSDSTDAEVIYGIALDAITKSKEQMKPSFLHLRYYRYLEHVGVGSDFNEGYRDEDEFKHWLAFDPISLLRSKLVERGKLEELNILEEQLKSKVEDSVRLAKLSKFPDTEELYTDVYV